MLLVIGHYNRVCIRLPHFDFISPSLPLPHSPAHMATRLPPELLNLIFDYAVPPPAQHGGPAHFKACQRLSLVHRTWTRQAQRRLYSTCYASWPRLNVVDRDVGQSRPCELDIWRVSRAYSWVEQAVRLGVRSWSVVLRIRAESPKVRGKVWPHRGFLYDDPGYALPPKLLRGMQAVLIDADNHAFAFNEIDSASLISLSAHSGELPRRLSPQQTPHLARLELTAMKLVDMHWPAPLPGLETLVLRFCTLGQSLPRRYRVLGSYPAYPTDLLFNFAPRLRNLAFIDPKTNISQADALGWMRRVPPTLERLFISTHNLDATQVPTLLASLSEQLAHLPRQIWLQALDDATLEQVSVDAADVATFKECCKERGSTFVCNEPWMDFEGKEAEEIVRRWEPSNDAWPRLAL
ncbi:hypothetical protein RTBOTA2_006224 [Rhodotorula toruloides]|nr:hypothetical protein RTBOTA2_006224 [Rhodotorula toruloides]